MTDPEKCDCGGKGDYRLTLTDMQGNIVDHLILCDDCCKDAAQKTGLTR